MIQGLVDWEYVATVEDAMRSMGVPDPDAMVAARVGSVTLRLHRFILPDVVPYLEYEAVRHPDGRVASCESTHEYAWYQVYADELCKRFSRMAGCNGSFRFNHILMEREIIGTAVHEVRHCIQSNPRFASIRWFSPARGPRQHGRKDIAELRTAWRLHLLEKRKKMRAEGQSRADIKTVAGAREFDAGVTEKVFMMRFPFCMDVEDVIASTVASDE